MKTGFSTEFIKEKSKIESFEQNFFYTHFVLI